MSDLLDKILGATQKSKTEYIEAPEVQALSEKLIEEYGFLDASMSRIKYLFKVSDKSKFAGKISKAGEKWKHITGYDYVMEVWRPAWEKGTPLERRALLYHELSHVLRVDTKKGNKWAIKDHPIEAFPEEIRMFGAWSSQLKEAESAMADFAASEPPTFNDDDVLDLHETAEEPAAAEN